MDRTLELLGVDSPIVWCPHRPAPISCYCRKAQSGMAVNAIEEYKLDPTKCIMVGDMTKDKTFVYMTDVNDITEADFIKLPSGYCFSKEELVSWLSSSTFNNINPHDVADIVFTQDNKDVWKEHADLAPLVNEFFNKKKDEKLGAATVLRDHVDVLYLVGKTGRICYYDNMHSFEENNSAIFEYSIEALAELSDALGKLPKTVKDTFDSLKNFTMTSTLSIILDEADKGRRCIHGVGITLISIFLNAFITVENLKVKYEPLKTGLYFYVDDNNKTNMLNTEYCNVFNTKDYYYTDNMSAKLFGHEELNNTSMVSMKHELGKPLNDYFDQQCKTDDPSFTIIGDDIENWEALDHWRKIMTEDNYCFDILWLINSMTVNLNACNMSNPYPTYPQNPFTGKPFTFKDLKTIRRRIFANYITCSIPLDMFLRNQDTLWSMDEAYTRSKDWKEQFTAFMERTNECELFASFGEPS
jgi:hypothetical protein